MNIHRIIPNTRAEGPGRRFAIWTQGCSRHCRECYASDTWSHSAAMLLSPEQILEQIDAEKEIEGITVLGGEPFEQTDELLELLAGLDPGLSVIVFTGNTIEELRARRAYKVDQILSLIDVLVDGPYDETKRSFRRPMAGSENQRFHFLTNRYSLKDFPQNRIEVRLDSSGTLLLNGMGDFDTFKSAIGRSGK